MKKIVAFVLSAVMAAACAGATEGPSMTVQFDSTGGSQQVTAQEEVDAWLAEAKAFLS